MGRRQLSWGFPGSQGKIFLVFFLSEMKWNSVVSDSLWPHGLYSPWNSLGQNTGVGSLSRLQGIFPTQGSNPSPHIAGRFFYHLSHKGSPFFTRVGPNFEVLGSMKRNDTSSFTCMGQDLISSLCGYLNPYHPSLLLLLLSRFSRAWLCATP